MISAFYFYLTIAGTFSTLLVNYFGQVLNVAANPLMYSKILCVFEAISYLGSVPFFLLAGENYAKKIRNS
jgi:hypothetical protein